MNMKNRKLIISLSVVLVVLITFMITKKNNPFQGKTASQNERIQPFTIPNNTSKKLQFSSGIKQNKNPRHAYSSTPIEEPKETPKIIQKIVEGNTVFTAELYKQISELGGNIIFSPYSIASALGMAYAGARGETALEIKNALHFDLIKPDLYKTFQMLNKQLLIRKEGKYPLLLLANALGRPSKYSLKDNFKSIIENTFQGKIFSGNAKAINTWISKKTNGNIRNVLEPMPINDLLIVNALYFKGVWSKPFNKEKKHAFIVNEKKKKFVDFMVKDSYYWFFKTKLFKCVSIPYRGYNFSMIIIIPNEHKGLNEVESELNGQNLNKWLSRIDNYKMDRSNPSRNVNIELHLPKFKLKSNFILNGMLKHLGIKKAFEKNLADFGNITKEMIPFYITKIIHISAIKVDKTGTEAKAITVTRLPGARLQSHKPKKIVLWIDHPFLFFVMDNRSREILFMGRVLDPTVG